ncbi:cytochrome c biogenesis protein CcsA [bacterium]|nr:cytochrome c biogenesis protein CcsA [bacterium]
MSSDVRKPHEARERRSPDRPHLHSPLGSVAFPCLAFLGSYGLACALLLALFALTLFGTLEQGSIGLYQAQQKYFESFFVRARGVPVFPGGYLLMLLLGVNMLIGAFIRHRTRLGLKLVHGGVFVLLGGALVTHHIADEGRMILNPGKTAASFESSDEWELVLTSCGPDKSAEYLIGQKEFADLRGGRKREFANPSWPFKLTISSYAPNAEPRRDRAGNMIELAPQPMDQENEANVPGLSVAIPNREAFVWGLERAPITFESGGAWSIHLRRRQYPLPFSLSLTRFIHENHPGTQIPAVYRSDLVLNDGRAKMRVSIKMNEPLRRAGYTFFQSSYFEDPSTHETASVLAVVRNPLEQLPLWASVLISIGLALHFGRKLARYLKGARKAAAVGAVLFIFSFFPPEGGTTNTPHEAILTPENIGAFGEIPIQDQGRIKPLATFARFKLIQFSGRSTLHGESATRWLMRVLLLPDSAADDKVFLIENPQLMKALGLPDTAPRARFSFAEILPRRQELLELAQADDASPGDSRDLLRRQTLNLYENVTEFQALARALNFLAIPDEQAPPLAIIPPGAPSRQQWSSPLEVLARSTMGDQPSDAELAYLENLVDLVSHIDKPGQFSADLKALMQQALKSAETRIDPRRLRLEVLYYKLDLFGKALALFILAFVGIAISWLAPRRKLVWSASLAAMGLATVLVAIGIVLRCVIRGRPPVTNLYETTLFVPAVAATIALGVEWFDRRRIAAGLGALLGAVGLFIAARYELKDGADTMGSLVAVLNSNFWLATHVTTISIGYSAGLLAGALAHVYLAGALMGRRVSRDALAAFSKMIYGVICFALLFSIVGTVLGGIWANDSWGRFWGWDPKENGALLIVLWCLAIVHARKGGYIREPGIALSAIGLAMVVVFSWWGVNLLGIGLHSYGFTSGILNWLMAYWLAEFFVIGLGCVWAQRRRGADPTR